ncbi:alpha/beta hydrolase fold [Micromonospora pallida]|uniref:Alpha/beta hydrolase fold n=1 Tax=Micromonospora pallida TaxID=145854 RepID=A0A1C6SFX0_9ACTN|nr:alpha/beta hydrolase [Micromonospora pallida]SCL28337.1 alpha/beta hydrolase fold [Micromonospora pallida]
MALDVRADDDCHLWTEQAGAGPPLVLCHGGPGLWDYLDPVARLLEPHARTIRWDQRGCGRSQRRGPYRVARFVADHGTALRHAEDMATPWLGINHDCNRAINAEVKQELATTEMAGQCRALDLPVLIVDGTEDIRPRWAVDSLHEALTNSQRVSLAGAGHSPWVESPDDFRRAVTTFLTQHATDVAR